MECREIRDDLTTGGGRVPPVELATHLGDCAACARFAERALLAGELLGQRLEVEPDAGFVARVVGALPEPSSVLGWAALRVLPATLALALVLGGWTLWRTQMPSQLVQESPDDDVLTWVMETEEVLP